METQVKSRLSSRKRLELIAQELASLRSNVRMLTFLVTLLLTGVLFPESVWLLRWVVLGLAALLVGTILVGLVMAAISRFRRPRVVYLKSDGSEIRVERLD